LPNYDFKGQEFSTKKKEDGSKETIDNSLDFSELLPDRISSQEVAKLS